MWFDRINRFYNTISPVTGERLWTIEMVQDAVRMNRITPKEYFIITQDKEYLKTLVIAGTITPEQYKEITGEDYVG